MTTKNPAEFFKGKTIEELAAIECGGRVLIPESLRSVSAKGEVTEHKVLLRLPTPGECAKARVDAVMLVADRNPKQMGRNPEAWTIDRAKSVVGADVFEDMDTYAIVARSLFEPVIKGDKPQQAYMLGVLYDGFGKKTVFDIWDRMNVYDALFNPRFDECTEDQFWGGVEAIAKVRNLLPLAVISGSAQTNFMVRMASELSNFRKLNSSSHSPETSTSD